MKKTSTLLVLMLLLLTTISGQAADVTDNIGGHIAGGKASVALVALLVDGTNTLRPAVVVRKETSGTVSFSEARRVGMEMAARAGARWRGWGLQVEGVQCINLELRQGAKMLRNRCEAGIIVGDWQGAIDAPDMATFSIAANTTTRQPARPPARPPAGGGGGESQRPAPTDVPLAPNPVAANPAANNSPPPSVPTTAAAIATSTPWPSDTPHATATLRPTATPRPSSTPTPRPTATFTPLPIIAERPATVVMPAVTERPSEAPAATETLETSVDAAATATATENTPTPAAGKQASGLDLASILMWLGLVVLAVAAWLGYRWWQARQMDKRAAAWAERPTVANDVQPQ